MFMHAMELVRMGVYSVKAYEHLLTLFRKYAAGMKPFTKVRDGYDWKTCYFTTKMF